MDTELAARVAAITKSPNYRLAEDDPSFMESAIARSSRLALEFMRVDDYLNRHRINSTVVIFGGARILAPDVAQARLAALEKTVGPNTAAHARAVAAARRAVEWSRYYTEARKLGAALTQRDERDQWHDFVTTTGGGPGIMEAANRGASENGALTIGFNIRLPVEQPPNPYVTPTLAFSFHYFALRKMHFLLRARALVAFPGGFGTLDEIFESLNLVQTGVIPPIPIILVGTEHWRRVVDFDYLVEQGFISSADRELVVVVETADEAIARIHAFHGVRKGPHP